MHLIKALSPVAEIEDKAFRKAYLRSTELPGNLRKSILPLQELLCYCSRCAGSWLIPERLKGAAAETQLLVSLGLGLHLGGVLHRVRGPLIAL